MTKNYLYAFIFTINSLVISNQLAAKETVIIGHNHVPPIAMLDSTGVSIDYINKIVTESGADIEVIFRYMPLARLIKSLQNGVIHGSVMSGHWSGGAKKNLSHKKYVTFKTGIVVHEDIKLTDAKNPKYYNQLKLCTKKGMPLTNFVQSLVDSKRASMAFVTGDRPLERCIKKMHAKYGVDGVYSPYIDELVFMAEKQNVPYIPHVLKYEMDIHFEFNDGGTKLKKIIDDYQEKNLASDYVKSSIEKYTDKYRNNSSL